MNNHEGFWYSVGDISYKFFELLESTYNTLNPNKALIVVGFIAFGIWMYVQQKYNKKAAKEGTLI